MALCALLIALALGVAGCGGDSASADAGAGESQTPAEQAFLSAMVPHHLSAIEMAEVATERAESPVIARLAREIISTQGMEIAQMERIHQRLYKGPLVPDEGAHEALGLTAEEAGMGHANAAATLRTAKPFDRAFVDEMVGHHRGAIAMAEAVLPMTDDPELTRLAEGIISAQTAEIETMNDFRVATYGAPVPEPAMDGMDGMHG